MTFPLPNFSLSAARPNYKDIGINSSLMIFFECVGFSPAVYCLSESIGDGDIGYLGSQSAPSFRCRKVNKRKENYHPLMDFVLVPLFENKA